MIIAIGDGAFFEKTPSFVVMWGQSHSINFWAVMNRYIKVTSLQYGLHVSQHTQTQIEFSYLYISSSVQPDNLALLYVFCKSSSSLSLTRHGRQGSQYASLKYPSDLASLDDERICFPAWKSISFAERKPRNAHNAVKAHVEHIKCPPVMKEDVVGLFTYTQNLRCRGTKDSMACYVMIQWIPSSLLLAFHGKSGQFTQALEYHYIYTSGRVTFFIPMDFRNTQNPFHFSPQFLIT